MARVGVAGGLADLGTTGWGGDDDDQGGATASTSHLRQQQAQLIRGVLGKSPTANVEEDSTGNWVDSVNITVKPGHFNRMCHDISCVHGLRRVDILM